MQCSSGGDIEGADMFPDSESLEQVDKPQCLGADIEVGMSIEAESSQWMGEGN